FFFQAEDGIRDGHVTGVQTCALPILTNCAHTKKGSRIQVSPLARNWMIVAMKLIAPSNDDVIRKINPINQSVCPLKTGLCPGPRSEERRVGKECRVWVMR